MAARLMQAASKEPEEGIFCDEDTFKVGNAVVVFEALPAVTLKGELASLVAAMLTADARRCQGSCANLPPRRFAQEHSADQQGDQRRDLAAPPPHRLGNL